MARQRNNVTKLPLEMRLTICQLLADGASYDDIRTDADVAAACADRNLTLHNKSLLTYSQSAEYAEYKTMRAGYAEELERRRLAAFFVQAEGGADAIANVASFELLRIVLDKLQSGAALEPKELAAASTALAAYQRNRISERRDDAARDYAAREAEYQARILQLEKQLAERAGASSGLTVDTLKKIEEKLGLL
ncbi:MAG: hypothetical protein VB042_05335 [Victivallaceae bacterium]|nr:hypothetical protein [Victivallaceae bacterium]